MRIAAEKQRNSSRMHKIGMKRLLADMWKVRVYPNASGASTLHPRTKSHIQETLWKVRRPSPSPTVTKRVGQQCTGRVWWFLRLFFFRTRTVGEMRRLGGGDELAKQQKQQSPKKRVWVCIYQGKVSTSEERKERGPKKRQYPLMSLSYVVVVCWCVSVSFQASVKCVRYES